MNTIQLSKRVQAIKPSATLAVSARAAELKAQGQNIISLGTGEPDFATPKAIRDAAHDAIEQGYTRYTPVDGLPMLKEAIIAKLARDNGLDYDPKQILVCSGAKQGIFNLAQALLNPGDEVIIPAPYWVSYPDIAKIAEATPVFINAGIEQSFKITPQQLEQAITPNTRLFIINSPSNPTGKVYTRDELAALGEVLLKHPQVTILTDDIYEHIIWNHTPYANIVMACPDLYERTLVLNGVSKAYAMTGWRIGYVAGNAKLIGAMKKIQSQSTSNPCSISQMAAVTALNMDQGCVREMVTAFKQRHDHLLERLNALPGVRALPSDGTFYCMPNVQEAINAFDDIDNDLTFAEKLLVDAGVALVPGSAFGAPGCIRLSYATDLDTLNDAVDRIGKVLSS